MNYLDYRTFVNDDGWCIDTPSDLRDFIYQHPKAQNVQHFLLFLTNPTWDIDQSGYSICQFFDLLNTSDDSLLQKMHWEYLHFVYIPQQYDVLRKYQQSQPVYEECTDRHYLDHNDKIEHFQNILFWDAERTTPEILQVIMSESSIIIPDRYLSWLDDNFFLNLLNKHGYKSLKIPFHFCKNYERTIAYKKTKEAFLYDGTCPHTLVDIITLLFEITTTPQNYPLYLGNVNDIVEQILYTDFTDSSDVQDLITLLASFSTFHKKPSVLHETTLLF